MGNEVHVAVAGLTDAFESRLVEYGSESQVRVRIRTDISVITDILDAFAENVPAPPVMSEYPL